MNNAKSKLRLLTALVIGNVMSLTYLGIFGVDGVNPSFIESMVSAIFAVSAIIVFLWMGWHCLKHDNLKWKPVWVVLFLVGVYFTAILYFFVIIRFKWLGLKKMS